MEDAAEMPAPGGAPSALGAFGVTEVSFACGTVLGFDGLKIGGGGGARGIKGCACASSATAPNIRRHTAINHISVVLKSYITSIQQGQSMSGLTCWRQCPLPKKRDV